YQGVCDSFTAIRQSRSVAAPASRSDESPEVKGLAHAGWRLIRSAWRAVRDPRIPLRRIGREMADFRVRRIHDEVWDAYRAGYEFHQQAVRGSDVLLAWVLKSDYWDYELPGHQ